MNTRLDTCSITLSYKQACLARYALLAHYNLIEEGRCAADKKAAALADIDALIVQLNRYILMSKEVAA